MAELSDTDIYGNLAVYGNLSFSGLVYTTGATTGYFSDRINLPSNPAGFFPIYLPIYSEGNAGTLIGESGFMVPFYSAI